MGSCLALRTWHEQQAEARPSPSGLARRILELLAASSGLGDEMPWVLSTWLMMTWSRNKELESLPHDHARKRT